MKQILVLGSEGFLGTVLVPHLIKCGNNIVGVDKCFFGKNNILNKNYKLLKKDYSQLPKKFFENFDVIVDLVNISNDPASELNKKFTNTTNYLNKLKLYSKIQNNKNKNNCSI